MCKHYYNRHFVNRLKNVEHARYKTEKILKTNFEKNFKKKE